MNLSFLQYKSSSDRNITILFLHGLMSDKLGSKSLFLYELCKKMNLNFLSFDNLGHGESEGNFIDQNISSWLSTANRVIEEHIKGDIIIVGSSKGGWLSLLLSLHKNPKIKGQILLAPAPDFTKRIWDSLDDNSKLKMEKTGLFEVASKTCTDKYPISYQLIKDGEKHLILKNEQIIIEMPTIIIQGMEDKDVDWHISLEIIDKIKSDYAILKLLKNSGHRLSSDDEKIILKNSVEEIISIINKN